MQFSGLLKRRDKMQQSFVMFFQKEVVQEEMIQNRDKISLG